MSAAEETGSPAQRGLLLSDLVGKHVAVAFNLPHTQWPIHGFPAWCVVRGVDSGMVCLMERWKSDEAEPRRFSLNIIESIQELRP